MASRIHIIIMKLQRIQNTAARLVTGRPRFCHVTPLLFHLHWLPIRYRIKFKILFLTFKCLYGLALNDLIELISIKKQSRYSLRSNESLLLVPSNPWRSCIPVSCTLSLECIGNTKTLDTFKTAVKTHLFNLACKYFLMFSFAFNIILLSQYYKAQLNIFI